MFRFPSPTERVSIVGRTGSGKSQMGAWLLSHANIENQPYVVVDYKGDDLLNSIEYAKEIKPGSVPKKPGIYLAHLHPNDEDGLEKLLLNIWEHGNIGVFFDEGYMVPKNSEAFNAILTQGRSKRIPAIVLSQRPAWMSRFVFSEADHFCVFHLNHVGDRKKIEEYLPESVSLHGRLDDFHSHWYDVKKNQIYKMQPVPSRETILQRFSDRLKPKPKYFF